jgi:hypothetical protein
MLDTRLQHHPEDRLTLPLQLEAITAEWLSQALAFRHPGVAVTSLHVGEVRWGTATKVRLLLDYNQEGHRRRLAPTMILKGGFGGHELAAASASLYAGEVEFYRHVADRIPADTPVCYFAARNPDTGQALILLRDLLAENVTFARAGDTVSPEVAAATLALQARFHAASWQRPDFEDVPLYPGDLRALLLQVLQDDYWSACLRKPRAKSVPEGFRRAARMRHGIEMLWTVGAQPPSCYIHGDAHLGNLYFRRDGSPGYVDWQMSGRGHWAHDVTYFLVGALAPTDRRRHERDLLRHYLRCLAGHGVPAPSFDEAWLDYRRHAVHGLFWVANADGMHPEETNVAMVERFSTAVSDLRSAEALDLDFDVISAQEEV